MIIIDNQLAVLMSGFMVKNCKSTWYAFFVFFWETHPVCQTLSIKGFYPLLGIGAFSVKVVQVRVVHHDPDLLQKHIKAGHFTIFDLVEDECTITQK